MAETRINPQGAQRFVTTFLETHGLSTADAAAAAKVIVYADLCGVRTHGLERLSGYHEMFRRGLIDGAAQPQVVAEGGCYAKVDARNAMGHSTAVFCMEKAIGLAEKNGMGAVLLYNGNHCGCVGYYPRMAVERHLLGFATTNSRALVVPTRAGNAFLGTNPIAFGMYAQPYPFLLDMATSVVPGGRVMLYEQMGKSLPPGWAVDENGDAQTDAAAVNRGMREGRCGGVLPLGGAGEGFGGHKGYGLGVMMEVLTGVLSGMQTSDEVGDGFAQERMSQFYFAMDYGIFGKRCELEGHLSAYLEKLRALRPLETGRPVMTHGQREYMCEAEYEKAGIPLLDKTREDLMRIAAETKLADAHGWLEPLD